MHSGLRRRVQSAHTKKGLVRRSYWVKASLPNANPTVSTLQHLRKNALGTIWRGVVAGAVSHEAARAGARQGVFSGALAGAHLGTKASRSVSDLFGERVSRHFAQQGAVIGGTVGHRGGALAGAVVGHHVATRAVYGNHKGREIKASRQQLGFLGRNVDRAVRLGSLYAGHRLAGHYRGPVFSK